MADQVKAIVLNQIFKENTCVIHQHYLNLNKKNENMIDKLNMRLIIKSIADQVN